MSLETRINMQLFASHISPKTLEEIFKRVSKDIKLLQEQPPLEVYPRFKNKKINYEEGNDNGVVHRRGFRIICVIGGCNKGFSYTLYDRAHVVGSGETHSLLADKEYTSRDLEILRSRKRDYTLRLIIFETPSCMLTP